jgi:hypothetical protein
MAGALDGLVVLDLTTHLSGPFCGMQLADMGADVIKIESPQGDSMRGAPPFIEGESAPFMLWNRNKRGLKLDLKNEDDLKVFWELVDDAAPVLDQHAGELLGQEALYALVRGVGAAQPLQLGQKILTTPPPGRIGIRGAERDQRDAAGQADLGPALAFDLAVALQLVDVAELELAHVLLLNNLMRPGLGLSGIRLLARVPWRSSRPRPPRTP